MILYDRARFAIVLGLALIVAIACPQICFGQTAVDQTDLIIVQQRLDDLAVAFPIQIRKIDDPTVRIFLKLRLARLLWNEPDRNTTAESLTVAALDELEANDAVPQLYADTLHRDLLALLQANAPDTAKKYARQELDVAYSMLNSKGKEALAIATLESELAKGWVPDLKLLFFLHRLEIQQPLELGRALSIVVAAEERRVGTIPLEVFSSLTDFYLKPDVQPDLKRRFLTAAVNSTKVSYTLSDSPAVDHAYNLLVAILPQVKSLTPSLYPQAAAQLSSLMSRVSRTRSQSEEIDERIRTSRDPLGQIITEATSASDAMLKDELFLQGARLALQQGKLKLSLELATSVSANPDRKKWQEQFLSELVTTAIAKKAPEIAGEAIALIQSQSLKIPVLQKLTLYFFESKDLLKARELLEDTLKAVNSIEDKTDKSLALLRLLPLIDKVNNEIAPVIGEQIVKSINSIPSPDGTDKAVLTDYVQKTLMPVTWQALPVFQSLAERDENLTLDLANRIQLKEIRTSALLGIAIAKLSNAKKILNDKRIKNRADSGPYQ
jgi:hypothetical protein